jgi:oligogalacturonide lyase
MSFTFSKNPKKIVLAAIYVVFLCTFPCLSHLSASDVGKRYPSEKRTITDRVTGRTVTVLTASEYSDAKPYQTHDTWTADGEWIIFRSSRSGNGGQLFLVNEVTGDIVQLTDDPTVNTGSVNLSRKEMKLFFIRGGRMGRPTETNTPAKPRQIVELNIGTLLKDAMANAVKAPETYERIVVTLPDDLNGGGLALDADETLLYLGVSFPLPEAQQAPRQQPQPRQQQTATTDNRSQVDSRNTDPGESREAARARFAAAGRGKSGIRSIDVRTGKINKVIDMDLRLGHLQANPWTPGEIIYCHETTGDAVQRIWSVKADGTGNRPIYAETPDEWITHETVSGPDELMFLIMGHLPYLREKPTGIAVINLRNNQMKLLGQIEEDMGNGQQGGFWHCNGSPDGRWAAGDTFKGSIYVIDRRTGERTLLTTGHRMRPDHAHPIFSRDSKRVLIQSGLLSDGKALNLMTVQVPE